MRLPGLFEHGPEEYTYEAPAMPLASRIIYIGAGGYLYALNAASGHSSWQEKIGGGDYSIPVVSPDGETVYVGGGGDAFYALDAKTGSPRWRHPYLIPAPVRTQPEATNSVVYFASGDNVYAVKADGTDYWKPHNFGTPVSGIAVANGSVYVGAGHSIYCLDYTTGRQCQGWHPYEASSQVSVPVLNYGKIYFCTQDGNVYALKSNGSLASSVG